MKKHMGILVASAALLASLWGCGGGNKDCNGACAKVYDQCNIRLQNNQTGGVLSKTECVTLCDGLTTDKQTKINCVIGATCDLAAINACF